MNDKPKRLRGQWRRAGRAALMLSLSAPPILTSCSTVDAGRLVEASLGSPRKSVEAFLVFGRAGLRDREYRCFSRGFTVRNGLSLYSYSEFRDKLESRVPFLRFASPRVLSETSTEARASVVVDFDGQEVTFGLIPEGRFRVFDVNGELLVDGISQFDEMVAVDGDTLSLSIMLDQGPYVFKGDVGGVSVVREWRIDSLDMKER